MKRMLSLTAGLLALLTASAALSQSPATASVTTGTKAPAPAATSAPVSEFKLANGMTVIVKPDRRAPTVVHMAWVRVGSMDEVDGTTGVVRRVEEAARSRPAAEERPPASTL